MDSGQADRLVVDDPHADAEALANGGEAMRDTLSAEETAARASALEDAKRAEYFPPAQETPEQAFARKVAEAPRTSVDVTRMEVCTGMIWLADGSRISFKLGVPPVITRAEGVKDAQGMAVYDMPWQLQCVVKPPKK